MISLLFAADDGNVWVKGKMRLTDGLDDNEDDDGEERYLQIK